MYDTIIIGAGQAGLAAGYYVGKYTDNFLLLDGHGRVGDSWRRRWAGLELFTPQRYNNLPGLPPPGAPWALIDRMEAADYLEGYARHFALPVQQNCTCVSARKLGGRWVLETSDGNYAAHRIIVATGAYKDAFVPERLAEALPVAVQQLHSSQVRSLDDLADGSTDVAIVGAGASGQQLARLCAAAGAVVTLLGARVGNLPRKLLGRDIYWYLYKSGLMSLRTDRTPGRYIKTGAKGVVTVGEPQLPDAIDHHASKLSGYEDGRLLLASGDSITWPGPGRRGVLIWCTGYRNTYPYLPNKLLDDRGLPLHDGGLSTADPTVAYLGLENQRHLNSSLLGGVGRDARQIVPKLFQSQSATTVGTG